jgi:hypothetical protein
VDVVSATNLAADALERLAVSLRRVGASQLPQPGVPQPPAMMGGGMESDQARAEYRLRLQDPAEIEALKRRLGLR